MTPHLHQLSRDLASAALAHADAVQRVAKIVEDRNSSKLKWLFGAFSAADANKDLKEAEDLLQTTKDRCLPDVENWVLADLRRVVESNESKPQNDRLLLFDKQVARLNEVGAEIEAIDVKVRKAIASLREAIEAIDTASAWEIGDMASKNPGIAMLSTSYTKDAKEKIDKAVRDLEDVKHYTSKKMPLSDLDDSLDFIVDMILSPSVDLFSFFSLIELEKAEAACKKPLGELETAANTLSECRRSIADKIAMAKKELAQDLIEEYNSVVANVPENLRELLATSNWAPSSDPVYSAPRI